METRGPLLESVGCCGVQKRENSPKYYGNFEEEKL